MHELRLSSKMDSSKSLNFTPRDHFPRLHFWQLRGELEFVDEWFLMCTPIPMIIITVLYLIIVLKLGPAYMKTRAPLALTRVLVAYNIGQVVASGFLLADFIKVIWPHGLLLQDCFISEEFKIKLAHMIFFYLACKLSELLDTIFFVLRKKQNQVTFLHVYHHTLVIWCTWLNLKYEVTYTTMFLGAVNTFVHIIMYTYYALSAYPNMQKYLWWKKYITTIQLIQFLLVFFHTLAMNFLSECKPSKVLFISMMLNTTLFLYLFGKFYATSYTRKHDNNNNNNNIVISKEEAKKN